MIYFLLYVTIISFYLFFYHSFLLHTLFISDLLKRIGLRPYFLEKTLKENANQKVGHYVNNR